MAEYTKVFHDLVYQLNDWPEDILISCYKGRLNRDLYNTCILRRASATFHNWYVLAEEVEIDQVHKYHVARPWKKSPPEKREAVKPHTLQVRFTACFKCSQEAQGGRMQNQPPDQESEPQSCG